ncbi:MAG: methyltransferase domain-containing protein [Candidatus Omnitrophica bacterium]|nr:methyltransferase domain-containing protein [Candidatus Omnitrophota bacterium]
MDAINETDRKEKAAVKRHFEDIAEHYDGWKKKNEYYYEEILRFLKSRIPPGKRVLDVGCGTGTLLASLGPRHGVGIDLSEGMVRRARQKHPNGHFLVSDCDHLAVKGQFDFIILIDLLDHLTDLRAAFGSFCEILTPASEMIVLTANPLWDFFLKWAEKRGLKMPEGPNRFVSMSEILKTLEELNLTVVKKGYRMFVPKRIPLLASFLNSWMPQIPFLNRLCLIQYLVIKRKNGE